MSYYRENKATIDELISELGEQYPDPVDTSGDALAYSSEFVHKAYLPSKKTNRIQNKPYRKNKQRQARKKFPAAHLRN